MGRTTTSPDEEWAAGEGEEVEAPLTPRERVVDFLAGPYPTLLSRLVLGSIFILSGLTKVGNTGAFATSIESYQVPLPSFLVDAMSVTLPVVELGIGIWLLLGLFTRLSAAISGLMMVVFIIAIGQAWARGIEADCGCFAAPDGGTSIAQTVMGALGPIGEFLSNEQIGPVPIVRDILLLLMSLHLIFVPTIFSLDQLRNRYRGQEEYVEYEEDAEAEGGVEEGIEEHAPGSPRLGVQS